MDSVVFGNWANRQRQGRTLGSAVVADLKSCRNTEKLLKAICETDKTEELKSNGLTFNRVKSEFIDEWKFKSEMLMELCHAEDKFEIMKKDNDVFIVLDK